MTDLATEQLGGGLRAASVAKRRDWLLALCLAALALIVFNANGRLISAGDSYAARHLPFAILKHQTILLDPVVRSVAMGRMPPPSQREDGTAYWIQRGQHGELISKYALVVPLVVTPLYLPAYFYLESIDWDPHVTDTVARVMEKLSASLIAASSVGLMFLLLRRRASQPLSLVLTLAYAFGTTTWVISSQALWSHGLAELLIVSAMLLVTGSVSGPRVAALGFMCALLAVNRPPDALFAAAIGLCGLHWAGRRWGLLLAAGAVPVALTLYYNLAVVGHIAGAYALRVHDSDYNDFILEGIAGLLFSPARGLFVFSPFLLFVPLFIWRTFRDPGTRWLTGLLWAAMAAQVLGYAMVDWRQGISWGPRWLTDMLPLLIWMLPPVLSGMARAGKAVFVVALVCAVAIQSVGAFWYTGITDTALLTTKLADRMQPLWSFENAAFIAEPKHQRPAADLFLELQGNIDLVQLEDKLVEGPAGERVQRELDVAGWALTDLRSPSDLAVLVDGREIAGTGHFFERPDVVRSLGVSTAAGWRLHIPVDHIAPGAHLLSVLVRAHPGGEVRLLRERRFDLPTVNSAHPAQRFLDHVAGQAVQRIVESQHPSGYWLTHYTDSTQWRNPRPELNTYLSAVMLDLAGSLQDDPSIRKSLQKAREFLRSQIESGGLVRYHGRPDAPTIGVLGCAITPDADDTALAWRTAPMERSPALGSALTVMRRYRTPDGLYRTWLASQKDYQCLDPGADPNPADIGIQMHVYLLLAEEDPDAAKQLCEALRRRVDDKNIWVYYSGAPPMVVLRMADVHRAGCSLDIPSSRLQPFNTEQQVWTRMASMLTRAEDGALQDEEVEAVRELLRDLATDSFAAVTRNPPMLYHNDLSATVRRYYWSAEIGYALWLRLYRATRVSVGARVADHAAPEGAR